MGFAATETEEEAGAGRRMGLGERGAALMSLREVVLLCLLVLAAALVTAGVALLHVPAALVTAGVLLGALAVLTLTEVGG